MDWTWISSHPWAYPALEVLHVLGIAVMLGNLLLLEVRVWGWGRALPVRDLATLTLPLIGGGFGLVAFSGALMLASQWGDLARHPLLWLKFGLIGLAAANALLFHLRQGLNRLDRWARAQTLVSLLIWVAVAVCGRWLAYA